MKNDLLGCAFADVPVGSQVLAVTDGGSVRVGIKVGDSHLQLNDRGKTVVRVNPLSEVF